MGPICERSIARNWSTWSAHLKCQEFPFLWHDHPRFELTLVVSGRGMRHVGPVCERFEANDLVLLAPGLPHTWESEGPGPCEALVLQFPEALGGEGWQRLPEMESVQALLARANQGWKFSVEAAKRFRETFLELHSSSPAARLLGLFPLLHRLAQEPGEVITGTLGANGRRDASFLGQIDEVISRRGADLRLEELAKELETSVRTLTRIFQESLGSSFVEYRNQSLLSRAARLLLEEPEMRIGDVAERSGFGSLPQFHRLFLAVYRMSPRKYRSTLIAVEASHFVGEPAVAAVA